MFSFQGIDIELEQRPPNDFGNLHYTFGLIILLALRLSKS